MRGTQSIWALGALGLVGLGGSFLQVESREQRSAALLGTTYPVQRWSQSRPFEAALREARAWHDSAALTVARDYERLGAWDPQANRTMPVAEWQQEMARDREGYVRQSRAATARAVRLARTPEEVYRVTAWQARLECDTGHPEAALRHARRLITMKPRRELSWLWLRRAARANGRKDLEQQADRHLAP
jgi:hypothetical protein